MNRRVRLFSLVLFFSIPFWFFVNIFGQWVEDIFYVTQLQKKPPLLSAQIRSPLKSETQSNFRGLKERFQELIPKLTANSVLVAEIKREGGQRILFEKNSQEARPIASLAKLMTAVIAREFYPQNLHITVSERAVEQMEISGFLRSGETLRVEDLLYIMLIESSNDAAFALAEVLNENPFVALMNLKAKELGMKETIFFNPMGLDPEDTSKDLFDSEPNLSSARDLAILAQYIAKKHPELLEILSKKEHPLYLEDGTFHHLLINTNELLGVIPEIIAGKTGYSGRAQGCLLTLSQGKREGEFLVVVVLGSKRRFEETKKILEVYYNNKNRVKNKDNLKN